MGIRTGQGSIEAQNGRWSVTVIEVDSEKVKRKAKHVMFTLYVTTPTHHLTLSRKGMEIANFDTKVSPLCVHPNATVLTVLNS